MAILAKKGSIIASNQGGCHRGFPQAKSGQRVVAVSNIGASLTWQAYFLLARHSQ